MANPSCAHGHIVPPGSFDHYEGRLDLGADPAIELTIDAASVQTGNRRRDKQLRSGDFFDAANQPRVRFVSDAVSWRGDTMRVHGRLFARDRSIALELDARVRQVGDELEIDGHQRPASRAPV